MGRFLAVFGGFWGSSGDDLGVFWGGPGPVLAWKRRFIYFQKIDFLAIGGVCAVFYDEFAHLVPVQK